MTQSMSPFMSPSICSSRGPQLPLAGSSRARLKRPLLLSTTAALALALTLALGCSDGQAVAPEMKLPLVSAMPVTIEDLEDRVTAVGELVAPQHAELSAEVDGRVTELMLVEGQSVTAGDPLLELDPAKRRLELAAARAHVSEAAASVENVRRQVSRQRELQARNISSQSALDDSETELRLAHAKLAAAKADLGVESRALEEATVRATFDGMVVRRMVSLGEYVQVGRSLVEIVSLNPIEVEFRVAEIDSSFVRLGQEVAVHVAPYPDRSFGAKVTVISPTIDPNTRTLRVKAVVDNAEGLLRPGLFARADLGLSVHEGVAVVPSSAVLQRVDGSVVFVLDGTNRATRRVVQLGSFQEGRVEVTKGLQAGDRVLVRGHADLLDGQQVRLYVPDDVAGDVAEDVEEGNTAASAAHLDSLL